MEVATLWRVPASVPAGSAPSRDLGLDALRGLAALVVLVFHVAGAVRFNAYEPGGAVTAKLKVGVPIFFSLSGYLLYRQLFTGPPRDGHRRYWLRRLARIVPAYWLALVLLALIPVFARTEPTLDVFDQERTWLFFAFGQVLTPETVKLGIPPAWSLTSEVVFYLLLPVLALGTLALRRRSAAPLRTELRVLGIAGLVCVAVALVLGPFRPDHPNLIVTPVMNALWFLPGMAWAAVSRLRSELWRSPRARLLAAAGAVGTYAALCLLISRGRGPGYQAWTATLEYACFAVIAGLLLIALTGIPRTRVLRPLAALGTISFGVYLWHVPILIVLKDQGPESWTAEHIVLPLLGLTFALSVLAGSLSWYLVERPVLRLAGRAVRTPQRARRPAARTPGAAPAPSRS